MRASRPSLRRRGGPCSAARGAGLRAFRPGNQRRAGRKQPCDIGDAVRHGTHGVRGIDRGKPVEDGAGSRRRKARFRRGPRARGFRRHTRSETRRPPPAPRASPARAGGPRPMRHGRPRERAIPRDGHRRRADRPFPYRRRSPRSRHERPRPRHGSKSFRSRRAGSSATGRAAGRIGRPRIQAVAASNSGFTAISIFAPSVKRARKRCASTTGSPSTRLSQISPGRLTEGLEAEEGGGVGGGDDVEDRPGGVAEGRVGQTLRDGLRGEKADEDQGTDCPVAVSSGSGSSGSPLVAALARHGRSLPLPPPRGKRAAPGRGAVPRGSNPSD